MLLCSPSYTVPFGLPSATCPRWLCIGRFPPPGRGGTVGSAVPSWRGQSVVASLIKHDKTTNTDRRSCGSLWKCLILHISVLPFEILADTILMISANTNDADCLDADVWTAEFYLPYLCCEEKQSAFPVACMIFPARDLSCEPCERRNRPSSFSSWERTAQKERGCDNSCVCVKRLCAFRGSYSTFNWCAAFF